MALPQSHPTSSDLDSAQDIPAQHSPHRYDISIGNRLVTTAFLAYSTGLLLGLLHGGKASALRFRAENSHRFPTTKPGWYLYHKAKQNYVLKASTREGNRMGLRLAPWVTLFVAVEDAVDNLRAPAFVHERRDPNASLETDDMRVDRETHRDFLSTTVAGLTIAGGFGIWSKLKCTLLLLGM